ncbi:MAG: glycosyltransferase [Erysipelotrichales bacterium]|nr:glycosyltransferase [Erysipelotrichales bacterium]
MNIIIFTDTYPPEINGVATSTNNLYKILKANGHNAYVVCTNPFGKTIQFENDVLRIPGIELKKLYSYRISNIYNSKAMKIVTKLKPDIVHVNTEEGISMFGRIVSRRLHIPLVYTYHTMFEDYTYYVTKNNMIFDRFAKKFVRTVTKILANNATEFIAPSDKTKDAIRTYGYKSYVNIVPTGIDFSKYEYQNIDIEKLNYLKNKYDLNNCFTVLSLGRVAKEKSIDICLRGFKKFLNKYNGKTKMLIVGGGPALIELQELAKELAIQDKVIFTGPVSPDEVPYYYHLGNVFVSASVTETQGLTFMEAMASRTFILARFDENLADVIIDNETGFYFESEDDFCDELIKVIDLNSQAKDKILNNAYELVGRYSLDNFYNNIMEVYKRAFRKYW